MKAIRLSRNFGQHAAITAGLTGSGRWTVVMDCDLQDPPEAIPDLYAKALEGHDIVFAAAGAAAVAWLAPRREPIVLSASPAHSPVSTSRPSIRT